MPTMTSFKWYLKSTERVNSVVRNHSTWRDILGLVVLELDVQTVFDPNLHFNGIIAIWRHAEGMDPYVLVLRDVGHPPRYCDPHKVPAHQTPRRSVIDSELGRDA